MKKVLLAILMLTGISTIKLTAQTSGTLDTSFNSTGILLMAPGNQHDVIYDVETQIDDRILYCGVSRFVSSGYNFDMVVGSRNSDGTPDLTFGTNGFISKDFGAGSDFAYAMALQPDNKLVVVGAATITGSNTDWSILRLNSDGSYDTTFSNTGILLAALNSGEDYAYDVVIQPDSKILIAGISKVPGFVYARGALLRLNADGSTDSTFGTNGIVILQPSASNISETFKSIVLLPSGNIIAGGWRTTGTTDRLFLAAFNSDGTLNTNFGTNGTFISNSIERAYDIALYGGNLYAGGTTSGPSGSSFTITCFDTLGVINVSFGSNGTVYNNYNVINTCLSILVQPDGKIVGGGTEGPTSLGDRNIFAARYDTAGTLDVTFGINGMAEVAVGTGWDDANAITLQQDGKIILGGVSQQGLNDMVIVRLLNDTGMVNTGLPALALDKGKWTIYPSPLTGNQFYISGDFSQGDNMNITLFSISGQPITKIENYKPADGEQVKVTLPSTLASGIYYAKVTTHDQVQVLPIVKY